MDEEKLKDAGVLAQAKDLGVDLLRGGASVPGALLGISDISQRGAEKVLGLPSTGDTLGSLWKKTGVPENVDKYLREQYSQERLAKQAYADKQKGFIETAKAYIENPSLIAGKVAESIPLMVGGGAIGAGLRGASGAVRGAIGEGLVGAGSAAQQVQEETGGLTPGQAGLAAASGVGTGVIGAGGGLLARRLGIPDPETWLAGAGAGGARGVVYRAVGGGLSEAAQETLQSGQEQAFGNLAMDRSLGEGVAEAMAVGALTGGAMGGGLGALSKPSDTRVDRSVELARKAEAAAKAGNEIPEIKRYAPTQTDTPPSGGDYGLPAPSAPSAPSADSATAQLAQFAQQGPLSAAAATAMGSGLAEQTAAKRMDQGPGESPLTLAEPATEGGRTRRASLDATLAQAPSMPLQMAREAVMRAAEGGSKTMVVPHPSGGFAIVPRSFLGLQEREQFSSLQKAGVAERSGPGMPIATQGAAQVRADRLTLDTGVEHQVVPHPLSSTKFSVRPIEVLDARPVDERSVSALQRERAKLRKSLLEREELSQREAAWQKSQDDLEERRRQNTARWEQIEADEQAALAPGGEAQDQTSAPMPDLLAVDAAANAAASSLQNDLPQPSQAQIDANNYKAGTLTSKEDPRLTGFTIKIETPRGSPRAAADGSWVNVAPNHYGRIKGIEGADGDALDIHVGQSPSDQVFVVSQNKPDGTFDEHKVMAFFDSADQAEQAYKDAYGPEWKGFGSIEKVGTMQDLKTWARAKKADLSAQALENLNIDVDVEVAETGERVKVRQSAREALIEARTRVRAHEQVLRCLRS